MSEFHRVICAAQVCENRTVGHNSEIVGDCVAVFDFGGQIRHEQRSLEEIGRADGAGNVNHAAIVHRDSPALIREVASEGGRFVQRATHYFSYKNVRNKIGARAGEDNSDFSGHLSKAIRRGDCDLVGREIFGQRVTRHVNDIGRDGNLFADILIAAAKIGGERNQRARGIQFRDKSIAL